MLDDPLHDARANEVRWSRVNMAEAIPGVPTPLDWTFWARAFDECSRILFRRLGLMTAAEAASPPVTVEDQFVTAYWGRPVVNVDRLRAMAARMPGGDPDAVELQLLGAAGPGTPAGGARRWAAVACAPVAVARVPAQLRAARRSTDGWWRVHARADRYATADAAAAGLAAAYDRFRDVNALHGLNLFVGQAAYDRVAKLAAGAGLPGLELDLTAGAVTTEEAAVVADVRRAAAGHLTVEEVLRRHGYHGPNEGVLSGRPWREDCRPLRALIDSHRTAPERSGTASAGARRDAEERLLAALSPGRRVAARAALRFADRHVPLREVGKAAFLQAIDGARAAARALGAHLAAELVLDDPEDVFFLTLDEAVGRRQVARRSVARRRARHGDYLELDVPESFTGIPEPRRRVALSSMGAETDVVGLAGSPGVMEGVARVVLDPAEAGALEPGEVLVCAVTDPGWAPLFDLAGAVVIDVGGPLSHGAIVAREMGIPCVIGTGSGTRRIRTGARVRVDGSAGRVELL
jgi:pyruvate,water dikinase